MRKVVRGYWNLESAGVVGNLGGAGVLESNLAL